jgi:serine phosphatase RsbU (regulator of sigma subunit)
MAAFGGRARRARRADGLARPVSFRRSLLTNLIVLVLGLGAAILVTSWLGTRRTLQRVTAALISRALDQTGSELHRFFDPVAHALEAAQSWGRSGLLRLEDTAALETLLVPLAATLPQLSAVLLADERERAWLLRRDGDGFSLRETDPARFGTGMRVQEWRDGGPRRESTDARDFDPRTRPWWELAIRERETPGVHWTAPYPFFTTGEPGITAAAAFDAGSVPHVVGLDVRLHALSEFTSRFELTRRGLVFVLTDDARLIGLPRKGLFASEETHRRALLRQLGDVGVPLLTDAAAALRARRSAEPLPTRFVHAGEPWWLGARRFELGPGQSLQIAVLLPETDLLISAAEQRVSIAALTLAALALAVLRAVRLAQSYGRPIEALVRDSDRISRGDLGAAAPIESPVEELSRLARAHEDMRQALRSLVRLERDLQLAQEIQLDTFPDRMPALPGYEVDAWSEPADETGGDTYDVIGLRGRGAGCAVDPPDPDAILLLLADATGHGVGPALSVTQVRAMLRMAARLGAQVPAMAQHLNEQLAADLRGGRFVTVWLAELDARSHVLWSLAAGQAPILHYQAGEDRIAELPADTTPLGIGPQLDCERATAIPLEPGDLVAVFSDGIYEARNPAGEAFGAERVRRLILAHRHQGASQLLAVLRDALHAFCADRPAADDRTAIVVKRSSAG